MIFIVSASIVPLTFNLSVSIKSELTILSDFIKKVEKVFLLDMSFVTRVLVSIFVAFILLTSNPVVLISITLNLSPVI